jgi:SAM-dependent methyltransferase
VKEEDIRPQAIFDEYLKLCAADTATYFAGGPRDDGSCPACEGAGERAFTKHGFDYQLCGACQTLFVNPRPTAEMFNRYYTDAPSAKYWATTFYKQTAAARREKLWRPKARLIRDILERNGALNHAVIDVGGGYGLFAQEMAPLLGRQITVIEPGPHLAAACREHGIEVVQKFLEDVADGELPSGPRAFVSFELFEHLHSPVAFLRHLAALMRPGDLFIFTTLSGTGLDIQVLWENSKSVAPPHHLNFLNPRSVGIVLRRAGFELVEAKTPGKLDVDILANNQALVKDRFWQTFLRSADEATRAQWQTCIAESGWSSHMMITARKP